MELSFFPIEDIKQNLLEDKEDYESRRSLSANY